MKIWQILLAGLGTLVVASALTVGPVRLPNNYGYINYTKGASPEYSLLECVHRLAGEEEVESVAWELWRDGSIAGTFVWTANEGAQAFNVLENMVDLLRDDGSLAFTDLSYDLSGEYLCRVTLSNGEVQETAKWEVLIVDSVSQMSTLHRSFSGCGYVTSYSTLAMYPEPVVRAGLYSEGKGNFYKEIPKTQWIIETFKNGSVSYSYSKVSIELDGQTPEDVSFYVMVGVMKADGNFIPISAAMDKNIVHQLHLLGCPEPRLETYQHIHYHKDNVTCLGEHRDTEATVTCKEGYHADGDVEVVAISCNETEQTWVLQDGTPARREDLECVMNDASSSASISAALLGAALVLQRFFLP